jgi:hypothetical protein
MKLPPSGYKFLLLRLCQCSLLRKTLRQVKKAAEILLSTWSFNIAIIKEDSRRENLETF